MIFILSSIVIYQQLKYTRDKDAGFNSDAIIIIPSTAKNYDNKSKLLVQKLKEFPSVSNAALQLYPPMDGRDRNILVKFTNANNTETRDSFFIRR